MPLRLLEPLAKSPFGCAGDEIVRQLAPLFVSRDVPRGGVVFVEGETEGRFFVVGSGRLKAYRNLPAGRSITVFDLNAGDFFGFIPLLDGGPFPVSVAATEQSHLFVLSREDFHRALAEYPSLCPALLSYTARRLRSCLDHVGQLGRKGACSRVANTLLGLVASAGKCVGGVEVRLPASQAEMARAIDITPENLSRALARLAHEKIIERVGPRRFRILDIEKLGEMAESTSAPAA